jgi:DNA-binding transcriptional MerR regulator
MARRVSFHTGEFAKIVGVNKRTLHYYDAEGIFRPAKVEPNGYRSYSFQQFYPFYILRLFRAMGLDLAEIKDYMSHRSPERLDRLLAEQQDWLRNEIDRLKRQQEIVRNQRALLALAKTVVCGKVEEKEMPATRLILSRNVRTLAARGDWPTVERIATEHTRYVAEKKAGAGFGIGMMVSPEDFLVPGGDEVVSYYFTVTERPLRYIDREYRFVRPAGRYLVTYFSGDYDDTSAAYALLREYLSSHGLVPSGCSYEESILEDMSTMRMEDDLTRIIVPVEERRKA